MYIHCIHSHCMTVFLLPFFKALGVYIYIHIYIYTPRTCVSITLVFIFKFLGLVHVCVLFQKKGNQQAKLTKHFKKAKTIQNKPDSPACAKLDPFPRSASGTTDGSCRQVASNQSESVRQLLDQADGSRRFGVGSFACLFVCLLVCLLACLLVCFFCFVFCFDLLCCFNACFRFPKIGTAGLQLLSIAKTPLPLLSAAWEASSLSIKPGDFVEALGLVRRSRGWPADWPVTCRLVAFGGVAWV